MRNLVKSILLSLCGVLLIGNFACSKKPEKKKGNILVLDEFYCKKIFINNDSIPDVSHGDVVSKIIERGLPEYKVDKKEFYVSNISNSSYKNTLKNMLSSKKYDAINISTGITVDLDVLSAKTQMKISPENIVSKVKELKRYLKNNPNIKLDNCSSMTAGGIFDILDVLDSISANGTKIYVSTTNEGPYKFNILSLIDNAICVGSGNNGIANDYSGSNSLVKRYFNDELNISTTKTGYSIDGGKSTLFMNNEVSNYSCKPYVKTQKGASFATPRALVSDFKKIGRHIRI